ARTRLARRCCCRPRPRPSSGSTGCWRWSSPIRPALLRL
ncbi:MAG: hypothetical protein AVDCRST_MAG48-670, partial [uncultured Friedmanniella sp.]